MAEEQPKESKKDKKRRNLKWLIFVGVGIFVAQIITLGLMAFVKYITTMAFVWVQVSIISTALLTWLVIFFIKLGMKKPQPEFSLAEKADIDPDKGVTHLYEYLYTNVKYLIVADLNTPYETHKLGKENQKTPILVWFTRNTRDWNEKIVAIMNLLNFKQKSILINPKPEEIYAKVQTLAETTGFFPKRIIKTISPTGEEVERTEDLPLFDDVTEESTLGEPKEK